MNTYKPTIPYFYIIEHIRTSIRYAGSKKAKGCNPIFLLSGCKNSYNTSSKEINTIIKLEGLSSMRIIEIQIRDDCYEYETQFLINNNCASSIKWYNKHNNTGLRDNSGYSSYYYITDPNKTPVSLKTNHPDILAQKVKSIHHGKSIYVSNDGTTLQLETNHPDVISGKYISFHKNKVVVKDKNNNYLKVCKTDPRYVSGELCGTTKNVPLSDTHRAKMSKTTKGRSKTAEHSAKISRALKGIPHTEERIQNIKAGIERSKLDPSKLPRKRICRLSDRKEMDLGNFAKYLRGLSMPSTINDIN